MAEQNYSIPRSRAQIKADAAQRYADQFEAWKNSDVFKERVKKELDDIKYDIIHSVLTEKTGPIKRDIHAGGHDRSLTVCNAVLDKIKEHNPGYQGSCSTYIESEWGSTYVRITVNPKFD